MSTHDTEGVLVDCDGQLVQEDISSLTINVPEVSRDHEGGGADGPDGHLHALLVEAEAEVSYDQLQEKGGCILIQDLSFVKKNYLYDVYLQINISC